MKPNQHPNFLWINTRDLSARHLGCYSDVYAKTPNQDRLAGGCHNLSYYTKEQLRPMKPLIPALQAALQNLTCFSPEHSSHIESMFSVGMFNSQRDMIANRWVIGRVIRRIELAQDSQ